MNKNAKNILTLFLSCLLIVSCKTVDLERQAEPEISGDASLKSVEDEKERNEKEMHEYLIQEELKVQDIAPTVVYVEKPVYVPASDKKENAKRVAGIDAARASQESATIIPENY